MSENKVQTITGKAIAIHGNDIDTDRIIPARFLKALSFAELGQYPFNDERFDENGKPKDHPFNRASSEGAKLIFANSNFGCGSSREHAPQSLGRWGISGLVAVSFGEIFAGNCEMLGMPAAMATPEDIATLQETSDRNPLAEFTMDLNQMTVSCASESVSVPITIAEGRRMSLINGHWDSTGTLVANLDKAKSVYESLPYTSGYK